jgi:hypothetical protein
MIKTFPPKLFSGVAGLLITITLCVSWMVVLALPAGADTSLSCGITTTSLPSGTVGTAYSAGLAASGGVADYTWTLVGTLPAGLSIDSATGIISGTPATAQTYSFTVRATDSASNYCVRELSIQVNAAVPAGGGTFISASILGGTDNFSLTNGFLAAAKELASPDRRVRLGLPAGASIDMLGSTQIGAATESNPPASTDNSTLVHAYSFIPSGATFSPAATLTLKYQTASLPAGASEQGLYIAFWNGTAWEKLSPTVNTTLKEVSAPVAHFSTFSLRSLPAALTTPTTPATPATPTAPTTPATPSAAAVISANLLNTTSSFSISGGTLSSATSLSSAGGKLNISLAANTTVSLPAGCLQITVIQLAYPPTAPADAKMVEAYAFTPDNATFTPAATLTVKYDTAVLPAEVAEDGLYIGLWENSTWVPLPSKVNNQAKTVAAELSHFSTYALLGKVAAAPPAPSAPAPVSISAFSTSDLTVSPESANPGQQVSVAVRVVNGGTGGASKMVILKINGLAQDQQEVKLPAGKSQVVSFNVSKAEPGRYSVSVDGQSTGFTVKEAGPAPDAMSIPVLMVIIAGGLLVIVLGIVLVRRQRPGGN